MRTFSRLAVVLVCVAMLANVILIHAQDATETVTPGATGTMVTCDSDLILSLYVAERYFGFAGVMDMMMDNSTDTSTMVDLNSLDKGQYAPLFTSLMGMMDQNMMMPNSTMTQSQMQSMSSMMTMSDADMMSQMQIVLPAGTDMSSMSTLTSAPMMGEDASCTMLRMQLNRFYTILAFQDMQTGMGMNSETGVEATSEATLEATMDMTSEPTMEATIETTAEGMMEMTAEPTMEATAEATP